MQMRPVWRAAAVAVSATTVLGIATLASAATGQPGRADHSGGVRHVLLISVDGLHQQDLAWYVRNHPQSALAALEHQGVEYGNAETPFPSDSFPGLAGQVTGGDPLVTGVYYDDTWNHDVFPAGTTKCSGPVPGGEVAYTEADDIDQNRLDAGQGLAGLPGSILQMTSNPLQVIDQKNLPVDPVSCNAITIQASGLKAFYAGAGAAAFIGVPASDARHPDVIGIVQHGVVYTGGKGKIAEHGGDDLQDRDVPILVVLPGLRHGRIIGAPVETTQIAPTILQLLSLNPDELQAVQIEHTRVLPGLGGRAGH